MDYIVALLGIRHVVLAVNKMDLVGYDQQTFEAIASDYLALAAKLGINQVQCIPLSALGERQSLQAFGKDAVVCRPQFA